MITSFLEKCFSMSAFATCNFSAASKLERISTRLRYVTYSWIFLGIYRQKQAKALENSSFRWLHVVEMP